MIEGRATSLAEALAEALGAARSGALVLRAARLELTLPPTIHETSDPSACGAFVAGIDAASLADASARLAALPADVRIAWAMPVVRASLLGWAAARVRRVQPVSLEDACDALRHAGVVDVRATKIDGAVPIVVLTGTSTSR